MRVRAFAKINRSLRVIGRRPDGYHELRTVFQSIALHDTITIAARRGPFRLTCNDPDCPVDPANLVWRAAQAAWRASGRRDAVRGLAIHLEKRIPLEAGLGGGSSDAAATLRALGRRWRIDRARWPAIAGSLGADVPYFLVGGTVLGLDRGDRLERMREASSAWVVVVIPPFGVSTKAAFDWWDRAGRQPTSLANDLQPVVARRHPEIAQLVAALRSAGAVEAAMSGSGSAVFGLFSREAAAVEAAASLVSPRCRAIVTRTLDRAAYQRLASR
jgi:4-diphosphocytidyl-2-C-methyl-D-erythritol kinase